MKDPGSNLPAPRGAPQDGPVTSEIAPRMPRCIDCSAPAPETAQSDSTLISTRYGWRLSLNKSLDGTRVPIWRCPACWAAFRGRQT